MKKTLLLNGKKTDVNVYIVTEDNNEGVKHNVRVEYFENPFQDENLTEKQMKIYESLRGSITKTLESIHKDFIAGNKIINFAFCEEI